MTSPERAWVLDLASIRATDSPVVGPKVARLGQLAQAGWRVPDGYAVTADALAGWLPPGVRGELDRLAASGQAAAARELVDSQPLPAWLADAIAGAHERLAARTGHGNALRVAVRSSGISEDGASASFAGQYATYLGVTGVPDVLRAVRDCWASGFSDHAVEYRRRAASMPDTLAGPSGMPRGAAPPEDSSLAGHHMAVGVLELIDVRCAGVAFTADPVTGDAGRIVVEGNWGFGEAVVSGQVTPDHWEVERGTGRIVAEHVTAKSAWSALDPATGRVTLAPLPGELAGQGCLTPAEVRHLCQQAVAIESAAGGAAQDIEWALARNLPFPDSVFILQHRPITTLAGPPQPPQPPAPAFDPVQYALRNVFKVPGAGRGTTT
jgi:pyruvate, water dikinase